MNLPEFWIDFKGFFIDLVKYGFPTIAILLSMLSYRDSRKAKRIQDRLNYIEEKLKKYELEEKEKQREEDNKACVEARVMNISKGNYRLKVWNSGKATAYNVDFEVPEELKRFVFKEKVPYEFLEYGKSFDEHVLVHMGTPSKFIVKTTWTDKQGVLFSKDQIVTI
jgi:hypothetical protein